MLFVALNLIAVINVQVQLIDLNVQGNSAALMAVAVDVVGSVASTAHLATRLVMTQSTQKLTSFDQDGGRCRNCPWHLGNH